MSCQPVTFHSTEYSVSRVLGIYYRKALHPALLSISHHFLLLVLFHHNKFIKLAMTTLQCATRFLPNHQAMDDLTQASCLNSGGAFQLVAGNTREARTLFLEALNLIKEAVNSGEADEDCFSRSSYSSIHLCNEGKEGAPLRSFVQSDCFICHQPLLFDPPDTHVLCDRMITLCSAAVLYNIALCHHGEGLQGKTKEIRKAIRLYEHCAALLREVTDTTSAFVQILLLNNLASCLYESADFFGAQVKIRDIVPIINASGEQCEFILREVMDELIFNAMNMISKTIMSARAA